MDYSYVPAEDSSAKAHSVSDSVAREQNQDNIRNSNEDLPQSVSLIPTREKVENQVTKKKEGENKMAISKFTNSKTAATSSGSNGDKGRIGQKMKTYKPDHKSLLDQRTEIQYLVDFKSKRIVGQPFPYATFSKHREKMLIYQLISLDGEPLPKLVLCTKCRRLLVLYRGSSTNLIRHFVRHERLEEAQRVAARNTKFIKGKEKCKPTARRDCSAKKTGGQKEAKNAKISKIFDGPISPKSEFPVSIMMPRISENSIEKENQMQVSQDLDQDQDPYHGHHQRDYDRIKNLDAGEIHRTQKYTRENKRVTEMKKIEDVQEMSDESGTSHSTESSSSGGSYKPKLGSEEMPIKIE